MTLDYLAGIVDGEGCVGLHSRGKRGSKRFIISVKMTAEGLIRELQSNFGGAVRKCPAQSIGWKDQWRWTLQGKPAMALYDQIKSTLRIK